MPNGNTQKIIAPFIEPLFDNLPGDTCSLRGRFDHGAHAAATSWNPPIASKRMNLVSLQLGALQRGCVQNDALLGVNLTRPDKGIFGAHGEDFSQHSHDIIVGVIVIVNQNDVVQRMLARTPILLWPDCLLKIDLPCCAHRHGVHSLLDRDIKFNAIHNTNHPLNS